MRWSKWWESENVGGSPKLSAPARTAEERGSIIKEPRWSCCSNNNRARAVPAGFFQPVPSRRKIEASPSSTLAFCTADPPSIAASSFAGLVPSAWQRVGTVGWGRTWSEDPCSLADKRRATRETPSFLGCIRRRTMPVPTKISQISLPLPHGHEGFQGFPSRPCLLIVASSRTTLPRRQSEGVRPPLGSACWPGIFAGRSLCEPSLARKTLANLRIVLRGRWWRTCEGCHSGVGVRRRGPHQAGCAVDRPPASKFNLHAVAQSSQFREAIDLRKFGRYSVVHDS